MRLRLSLLLILLTSSFHGYAAERILALTPHSCEILFALGAQQQIVGAVDYCDYPEAAKKITRVGGYRKFNLEVALRLRPTLAITLNPSLADVLKLKKLGVRIHHSDPQSVDAMLQEILILGSLTGTEKKAKTLHQQLSQQLQNISKPTERPTVFYEIWSDPLITTGKQGWLNDAINRAGGKNIFDSLNQETVRTSLEPILRANPKVIIIPATEGAAQYRKEFWRKWLSDKTVIIVVNPDLLHRPTPRGIQGIKQLAAQLEKSRD